MSQTRWILHADMDAFYASIEQRDRPELRGRPVIVGATSPRGVVAAASYEARRFGVHSAMPGFRARELCPHGVYLRPNMARYLEVSRRVRGVFQQYTSAIEPLALDEAFLDITGSLQLFEGPLALGTSLKKAVFDAVQLPVSIGIAPSKLVAKIACTLSKPDGLKLVADGDVQALLDPLDVRRLWGVGPVLAERLAELNIRCIRQLRLYDPEWLRRLLGDRAHELQARARGIDARPVETQRAAKSYGEENTFERDVSERAVVTSTITSHSEAVARRLRHDAVIGRTITLKVKFAERRHDVRGARIGQRLYPTLTRRMTLATGTDDASVIRNAAIQLWDQERLFAPIRLLGVAVSGISGREELQLSLFERPEARPGLGAAMDAIQEKYGDGAIRRGGEPPEKVTPSLRWKRGG